MQSTTSSKKPRSENQEVSVCIKTKLDDEHFNHLVKDPLRQMHESFQGGRQDLRQELQSSTQLPLSFRKNRANSGLSVSDGFPAAVQPSVSCHCLCTAWMSWPHCTLGQVTQTETSWNHKHAWPGKSTNAGVKIYGKGLCHTKQVRSYCNNKHLSHLGDLAQLCRCI